MLCEKCKIIELDDRLPGLEEITLDDERRVLHSDQDIELDFDCWDTFPELPDLKASAESGCDFCGLLRSTLQDELAQTYAENDEMDTRLHITRLSYVWDRDKYQDSKHFWNRYSRTQWGGLSQLNIMVRNADLSIHTGFCFDILADQRDFVSQYLRIHCRPLLDSETLSSSNIEKMKSWTENCHRSHSSYFCARDSLTPTRLIDLGGIDQPIRLISTSEDDRFNVRNDQVGITPPYLALSYCWGRPHHSRPLFKTETVSLDSRMTCIDADEVPKTIADAFSVTRALGHRFLWIDALCIIQDDEADWQRESALMGRIFGSAMITLVAALPETSHDGFLSRPKAKLITVAFNPSRRPDHNGYFYLQRSASVDFRYKEYWRNVDAGEWNKRAWTLQENLKSKCLLIFGPMMFHFRCQQELRAENTQAIRQPDAYGVSWNFHLSSPSAAYVAEPWQQIIKDYSGRKLTYALDKLPAISALAHDIQERTGVQYLAGLWRDRLVWTLLWECFDYNEGLAPVRSEVYRAPSWSWAAGDGTIAWCPTDQPLEFNEEVVILDAETTVVGEDPLGRVVGGSLTLTGRIQHASSLAPGVDDFGGHSLYYKTFVINGAYVRNSYVSLDWGPPSDVVERMKTEGFWLFLLASYIDPEADRWPVPGDSEFSFSGLVLLAVNNESRDKSVRRFQRVGIFRVIKDGSVFETAPEETIIIV